MVRIAIIIPAYNEEATLAATVSEYRAAFPEGHIVVVDNNSSDGTYATAVAALGDSPGQVLREQRQGKGQAVRKALSTVDADVYVMTDADLTYEASDARRLSDHLIDGRWDMAVGDRVSSGAYAAQNSRPGHSFGNALLTRSISALCGARYRDVLSGLRVMSRPFVRALDVRSEGFQLEAELNIIAAHLRATVVEQPIAYRARPDGSASKLDTIGDGIRISAFALTNWISFFPLQIFSILAVVAGLLSLGLAAYAFAGFAATGFTQMPYPSSLVVSLTAFLFSVHSFFAGLILHILNRTLRRRDIAEFLEAKRLWSASLPVASPASPGASDLPPRSDFSPASAPAPASPKSVGGKLAVWMRSMQVRIAGYLTLALAGILSVANLGADRNWDLLNYHLYNPYALLNGKIGLDVAPAQMQSYFNPFFDLPFYAGFLFFNDIPFVLAMLLALPVGGAAVVFLRGTRYTTSAGMPPGMAAVRRIAALAVGFSGAAVVSTAGTTINETPPAALILLALVLGLRRIASPSPTPWAMLALGAAVGVAAGGKLSYAVHAVGVGAAFLLLIVRRQVSLQEAVLAFSGAVGGFVLTAGWWSLILWNEFGNPLFPMMNDIFKSPYALILDHVDRRFLPESLADAVMLPWRYAAGSWMGLSELPLRSAHLLLIAALAIGALGATVMAGVFRGSPQRRQERTDALSGFWFLLTYSVVAFALWANIYGIYRYLVPVEFAAGLLLLAGFNAVSRGWLASICMMAAAACIAVVTWPPDFGRAPLSQISKYITVEMPALQGSDVLLHLGEEPVGYLAAHLPSEVAFVNFESNFLKLKTGMALEERGRARLAAAQRVFEVRLRGSPPKTEQLAYLGYLPTDLCRPIVANIGGFYDLCELEPAGGAAPDRHDRGLQ